MILPLASFLLIHTSWLELYHEARSFPPEFQVQVQIEEDVYLGSRRRSFDIQGDSKFRKFVQRTLKVQDEDLRPDNLELVQDLNARDRAFVLVKKYIRPDSTYSGLEFFLLETLEEPRRVLEDENFLNELERVVQDYSNKDVVYAGEEGHFSYLNPVLEWAVYVLAEQLLNHPSKLEKWIHPGGLTLDQNSKIELIDLVSRMHRENMTRRLFHPTEDERAIIHSPAFTPYFHSFILSQLSRLPAPVEIWKRSNSVFIFCGSAHSELDFNADNWQEPRSRAFKGFKTQIDGHTIWHLELKTLPTESQVLNFECAENSYELKLNFSKTEFGKSLNILRPNFSEPIQILSPVTLIDSVSPGFVDVILNEVAKWNYRLIERKEIESAEDFQIAFDRDLKDTTMLMPIGHYVSFQPFPVVRLPAERIKLSNGSTSWTLYLPLDSNGKLQNLEKETLLHHFTNQESPKTLFFLSCRTESTIISGTSWFASHTDHAPYMIGHPGGMQVDSLKDILTIIEFLLKGFEAVETRGELRLDFFPIDLVDNLSPDFRQFSISRLDLLESESGRLLRSY